MKKILAAVDFSEVTPDLLATASELARDLQGELLLLHVEAPEPDFANYAKGPQEQSIRDHTAQSIVRDRHQLAQMQQELATRGIAVRAVTRQGPTVEQVLVEMAHFGADLLVLGTHGHGALRHLLLGSVSEALVRQAPCPVVLVRSHAPGA